jgi:hypothetical protein
MKPSHLFWVCVVAAAVLFVAAVAGSFAGPVVVLLVIAGVAALAYALVSRRRADHDAVRMRAERDTGRFAELKSQLATTGTPVVIAGSNGVWMLVLMAVATFASLYYVWVAPGVRTSLLAGFLALVTALVCFTVWPARRRPVLVIRPDGIDSAVYGSFTWDQIDGMDLRHQQSEGTIVNHFLDLRIPDLAAYAPQMHGAIRWIRKLIPAARRVQHISIRLSGTTESPAVIHRLCRDLWTARTGKNHLWYAGMSEQNFELLVRGKEQLGLLEAASDVASADPALAMKLLDEFERATPAGTHRKANVVSSSASLDELKDQLREMKQTNREWQQRAKEVAKARRKMRSLTWAVTAVVIALVLVGAYAALAV